ncbi:pyridoxal 5'-phosphate synthase glutaminase subunit PdxT [Candidatus Micrarchaeota archaeon CG10_big_fil_rev_8_21_14_0_10_59_7]|nr:MAG: pyridoxal 5'-phosphate synthase glutaminase subunit PdxT [Candidatus Micrarchaeota archaeon CG10_big_fil_rev_8_21_14_0_10_59_7]
MRRNIGVLGLQGAVSEHIDALARAGAYGRMVRRLDELDGLDGLVIPGGESTTIGKLMQAAGIFERVRELAKEGFPVYGTCAGMILLAKKGGALAGGQRLLGLMDMEVERNAFGRQRESFEADVDIEGVGKFPCAFIRAPAATKVWGRCKPLGSYGKFIVAARQGNLFATAFHPELVCDSRVHEYFLREFF